MKGVLVEPGKPSSGRTIDLHPEAPRGSRSGCSARRPSGSSRRSTGWHPTASKPADISTATTRTGWPECARLPGHRAGRRLVTRASLSEARPSRAPRLSSERRLRRGRLLAQLSECQRAAVGSRPLGVGGRQLHHRVRTLPITPRSSRPRRRVTVRGRCCTAGRCRWTATAGTSGAIEDFYLVPSEDSLDDDGEPILRLQRGARRCHVRRCRGTLRSQAERHPNARPPSSLTVPPPTRRDHSSAQQAARRLQPAHQQAALRENRGDLSDVRQRRAPLAR